MKEKLKDYKNFNMLHLTDYQNSGSFSKHFELGTFDLQKLGNHIDVYPYVQMSKHKNKENRYMNEIILNVFGMLTSPDAKHFVLKLDKGKATQIAFVDEINNLVQRRFVLESDAGEFKVGLKNDPESIETFTWTKLAGDSCIRVEHGQGSVLVDEKTGPIPQDIDKEEKRLRAILANENVPKSLIEHIEKKIADLKARKNSCVQ